MKALFTALSVSLLMFASPGLAQTPSTTYADAANATKDVGEAYFAAYIARDWDAMEVLMAEENSFRDDTAALVFGAVKYLGKDNMLKGFREGYASVTHMDFKPIRRMFAGHFAVFEGNLDWGINLDGGRVVNSEMPFVVILRVEDGKVVEHRDYADYSPFLDAMRSQKKDPE